MSRRPTALSTALALSVLAVPAWAQHADHAHAPAVQARLAPQATAASDGAHAGMDHPACEVHAGSHRMHAPGATQAAGVRERAHVGHAEHAEHAAHPHATPCHARARPDDAPHHAPASPVAHPVPAVGGRGSTPRHAPVHSQHEAHAHEADEAGHTHAHAAHAIDAGHEDPDASHAHHAATEPHDAPPAADAPDLPATARPRTPVPAPTDADRAAAFPELAHAHATHDRRIHAAALVDRLEWQDADGGRLAWEGEAWVGGDVRRLWLRTEGASPRRGRAHGSAELLYGQAVSPWWELMAGLRRDAGDGPSRTRLALGVQGHAPYKVELEANVYLDAHGRSAAAVEAGYETLLTNRLILQWHGAAHLQGQRNAAIAVGSGLSTVEGGLRLRYEFDRRFAPYVGVQAERAFGGTAAARRDEAAPVRETRWVAGIRLRFW